ncbi:MAG: Slp family lipoprotein [Deltaproteobacteria bacterium]|nr:Slp family lipoprotein [Deltaproteobacteria bacterium]
MKTLPLLAVGIPLGLALSGCASVISQELRAQAVPLRGLFEVQTHPDAFLGKTVILGGEIIETRNRPDGTTLLVLDKPLGVRDAPETGDQSDGRFMVEVTRYLDPVLFAEGRAVTVAGMVAGTKTEPVGQAPYAYVVLHGQEVYLWRRVVSATYPPYPYYGSPFWYDPFWYDPFWGPGPGWWRPRFDGLDRHRKESEAAGAPAPSATSGPASVGAEHR